MITLQVTPETIIFNTEEQALAYLSVQKYFRDLFSWIQANDKLPEYQDPDYGLAQLYESEYYEVLERIKLSGGRIRDGIRSDQYAKDMENK